jgi:hypothetical protein
MDPVLTAPEIDEIYLESVELTEDLVDIVAGSVA